MARITLRLDDALHDRIIDQARAVGTTPSAYVRDVLDRYQGFDPAGYHARFDELHATAIQTLCILGKSVGKRAPDVLEEGVAEARRILHDKGLLDPEQARV